LISSHSPPWSSSLILQILIPPWYTFFSKSQTQSDWDVINGIRADSHGFTDAYWSVEKDTIAYRSETCVHTHNAWVLWVGHDMICMLLIGCTVCICKYWMYERAQEGMLLA
jgi:hypothetical protein